MTIEELMKLAMNYGLGVLLSVFGAIAFWKILNRVFDENAKRDERIASIMDGSIKTLTTAIQNLNSTMIAHNISEMAILAGIQEGNKFQRDEHERIILLLNNK